MMCSNLYPINCNATKIRNILKMFTVQNTNNTYSMFIYLQPF